MNTYVRGSQEIDKTIITLVAGKGANLGSYPGSMGFVHPKAFMLPPKLIKELSSRRQDFLDN